MKYKDIKICEVADEEMRAIAQPLIKYFRRNCNDEKRINQQLTNLRKNLETYPEKRPGVIRHLPGVLANLVSNTVYPIRLAGAEVSQIGLDGFSLPLYKREMCGTGGGNPSAPRDGTTTGNTDTIGNNDGNSNNSDSENGNSNTTGQNGDGENGNGENGDSNTTSQNGDGSPASVADTFSSEMGTFEGLIDQGDWDGAIAFLDANPDFEGAIGSTFRSDIQGKIDADAAVERNRIAQDDLAASIAAKEAQARIDAIELEREAEEARIAQEEAEADRLEAEAAAEREAAEKLERERIAAEGPEEDDEDSNGNDDGESEIEEFDWEDLQ